MSSIESFRSRDEMESRNRLMWKRFSVMADDSLVDANEAGSVITEVTFLRKC